MFDRGLDVFHIRKKHLDAQAIQEYVHQIDPIHRHKLVLHHFQQLAIPGVVTISLFSSYSEIH